MPLLGLDQLALDTFEQQLPYALVMIDEAFDVVWTNPGFARLLGYADDEVLGASITGLVHPSDLETLVPMAVDLIAVAPAARQSPSRAAAVELLRSQFDVDRAWLVHDVFGELTVVGPDIGSAQIAIDAPERRSTTVRRADPPQAKQGTSPQTQAAAPPRVRSYGPDVLVPSNDSRLNVHED